MNCHRELSVCVVHWNNRAVRVNILRSCVLSEIRYKTIRYMLYSADRILAVKYIFSESPWHQDNGYAYTMANFIVSRQCIPPSGLNQYVSDFRLIELWVFFFERNYESRPKWRFHYNNDYHWFRVVFYSCTISSTTRIFSRRLKRGNPFWGRHHKRLHMLR